MKLYNMCISFIISQTWIWIVVRNRQFWQQNNQLCKYDRKRMHFRIVAVLHTPTTLILHMQNVTCVNVMKKYIYRSITNMHLNDWNLSAKKCQRLYPMYVNHYVWYFMSHVRRRGKSSRTFLIQRIGYIWILYPDFADFQLEYLREYSQWEFETVQWLFEN